MNTYLKEAKKLLLLSEPILFVIGNESCDLDSVISAIGLAFFYTRTKSAERHWPNLGYRFGILPVLNIPRVNLPLKTDVTFFMKRNNIELENLVCSDEVPFEVTSVSNHILVDHHVPSFKIELENILEIIDHRPIADKLPQNCRTNISEVGSCATLVADLVLKHEPFDGREEVLRLLHGPIILDTVNFSKAADKSRPLDVAVNEQIESLLHLNEYSRNQLFNDLVSARSDVSQLDSLQILSKDLKVISNRAGTVTVAVPGFPISVEEYISKIDVESNMHKFGEKHSCNILVLMGMKINPDGSVERDLGLIALNGETSLTREISDRLLTSSEPNLQLQHFENLHLKLSGCYFYKQINIKASRKQILPIVQKVLDEI